MDLRLHDLYLAIPFHGTKFIWTTLSRKVQRLFGVHCTYIYLESNLFRIEVFKHLEAPFLETNNILNECTQNLITHQNKNSPHCLNVYSHTGQN